MLLNLNNLFNSTAIYIPLFCSHKNLVFSLKCMYGIRLNQAESNPNFIFDRLSTVT